MGQKLQDKGRIAAAIGERASALFRSGTYDHLVVERGISLARMDHQASAIWLMEKARLLRGDLQGCIRVGFRVPEHEDLLALVNQYLDASCAHAALLQGHPEIARRIAAEQEGV